MIDVFLRRDSLLVRADSAGQGDDPRSTFIVMSADSMLGMIGGGYGDSSWLRDA